MRVLQDAHGRRFKYLRLSVTDACNFRCAYCLPDGWRPVPGAASILDVDEVRRLVRGFAAMGVEKVRLTGGEPTVRRDLTELVAAVAAVPGIRKVALTTNGHDLERLAPRLRDAGLHAINISVDSLDPARFEQVTGRALLDRVLRGVTASLQAGLSPVKVNVVLLRGLALDELRRFLDLTRDAPISVRFIELMRTGCDAGFFAAHHLPVSFVQDELAARGWARAERGETDGPAVEHLHAQHQGRVGVIAPTATDFCASCNRLRVSSRGALRLCLFGDGDVSLRHHLREDGCEADLAEQVEAALRSKPPAHRLLEGNSGRTWNLAEIGG